MENKKRIGYACAYTPLAMIHAAGFTPWRILPVGDAPDQAGRLLHDNLCPHAKRILDRAMSKDLPELSGMVFMNSCDAMRRLADAWHAVRPEITPVLVDLPATNSPSDIAFFETELRRFSRLLEEWSGTPIAESGLAESIGLYNHLAEQLGQMRQKVADGTIQNGALLLQDIYRQASTTAPEAVLEKLGEPDPVATGAETKNGVPIFLFGNMMPEIESFSLFEDCGARIIGEDLCTGSRLFSEIPMGNHKSDSLLKTYADGILNRPPCARTMTTAIPGKLAMDIVETAKALQVKGVIGHTLKFCDPYIARLPAIRAALKQADIPFLMLEGDCTVRSMGQQKTRIEAFIEMLR